MSPESKAFHGPKRMISFPLRHTGALAGVSTLLLLVLSLWNLAMTSWQHAHNPTPGRFYSVDGHQMHLYCSGTGSPTIVIEAGLGYDWLEAQEVQPQLSPLTRVCTYDRSGLGWSEPRPGPRDAVTIAHQLHTLLDVAGVQRPLVLMGHSAGGIYVRDFAGEFPDEVTGIVLVDSATPRQFNDLPGFRSSYEDYLRRAPEKSWWKKLRIESGLQRLAGKCRSHPPQSMQKMAGQYDAEMCRSPYQGGEAGEFVDFAKAVEQAALYQTFGGKMLLILSADPAHRTEKASPSDKAVAKVWDREQEEMKSLSRRSSRVIARGSGHNIYHDRPDVVISEVSQFIASLREEAASPFENARTD